VIKALCIVLALVAILAILWMVARMPGRSFRGKVPGPDAALQVLREALRRDVVELAGTIGERNVIVETSYAKAAGYIEQSLREAGYAT